MDIHQQKFMCIKPEEMRLNGDYNSENASLIEITIEKCHGHEYCKSDKELKSFFESEEKYLLMLTN